MFLREKAFCFALNEEACSSYCSSCTKSKTESCLSRCSSCKLIYYCSQTCQKNDWYLHRVECKYIKVIYILHNGVVLFKIFFIINMKFKDFMIVKLILKVEKLEANVK